MSARNEARIERAGPICVTGLVRVELPGGEVRQMTEAALCRCGQSADKPFCDGSHAAAGFDDPGLIEGGRLAPGPEDASAEAEEAVRPVTIACAAGGPLLVRGPLAVVATDGRTSQGAKGALCRCGVSSTKPFCDGSHRRIDFKTA